MNQGPRDMNDGTNYPRGPDAQRRRGVILHWIHASEIRTRRSNVKSGETDSTEDLSLVSAQGPYRGDIQGPPTLIKQIYVASGHPHLDQREQNATYGYVQCIQILLCMYSVHTPFIIADLHTYSASSSQSVLRQRYKRDT